MGGSSEVPTCVGNESVAKRRKQIESHRFDVRARFMHPASMLLVLLPLSIALLRVHASELNESCTEPPLQLASRNGSCDARLSRWYWNDEIGACQDGIYFGCESTANNFASLEECMNACEPILHEEETKDGVVDATLSSEFASIMDGLRKAAEGLEIEVEGSDLKVDGTDVLEEIRDAVARTPTSGELLELVKDDVKVQEGISSVVKKATGKGLDATVQGLGGILEDVHSYIFCFEPALHKADGLGTCTNSWPSRRAHFDIASGECQYGAFKGCEASGNNFKTLEECRRVCEPAKVMMELRRTAPEPLIEDDFKLWIPATEDEKNATTSSSASAVMPSNEQYRDNTNQTTPEVGSSLGIEACSMPPLHEQNDVVCAAYIERWYYDVNVNACRMGVYGGCGASPNNFRTWEDCNKQCGGEQALVEDVKSLVEDDLEFLEGVSYLKDLTISEEMKAAIAAAMKGMETRCLLSPPKIESGILKRLASPGSSCSEPVLLWHYDSPSKRCVKADLGQPCTSDGQPIDLSKDKTVNAFLTSSECTSACAAPGSLPEGATCFLDKSAPPCGEGMECAVSFGSNAIAEGLCRRITTPDFCSMPAETGLCRAYFERWHFDANKGVCNTFVYGGCGGNSNNFMSQSACEKEAYKCMQGGAIASTARENPPQERKEFTLSTVGTCGEKFRARIQVQGATPGSAILFVRGRNHGDSPAQTAELPAGMPCGSTSLALHNVYWAKPGEAPLGRVKDRDSAIARVDSNGVAVLAWPGYQPGDSRKCTRHEFQAVDLATCKVSNVVSFTN